MAGASLFVRFGVALFIGFLIGLQRQYAFDREGEIFAGVRTFSLLSLLGCTAAYLSDLARSPLPLAISILVVGAFVALSYFLSARQGQMGGTTEVAAVLTVLVGAVAFWQELSLAVALGVTMTAILSLKVEAHSLARRITSEDVYASLKFAVISAIILPVLPNQTFGPPPFDILNPYQIWWFVVLISGVSFVGYILLKIVDVEQGVGLLGLLGGLASSTATTLSFTQRGVKTPELARPFTLAILIAWTVMFGRIVAIVAAINPILAGQLWLPFLAPVGTGLLYCGYLYYRQRTGDKEDHVQLTNPFNLTPAIKFGLLFTVILLFSKGAQHYLGSTGLLVSAVLSGLADVDAISLSVARLNLVASGPDLSLATQAILLAALANTFAKGGLVILGGGLAMRRTILPALALMLGTGLAAFLLI